MADIVINPAIGKIDFFTTKGDNVTNTLKLTGNTLLVTGPLSASSISTGGGGAFVTSVQPTTNYLSKFTGNSTIANSVIYDNGTNVGIGSTSPTFKLDVNGSIALSGYRFADFNTYYNRIFEPAGNTAIYLGNASDPTNYSDNTNHAFRNRGGSSVYAYINSNGNLGIGTTSPGAPLTIYRASNPWIRVNGGGAFSYIQLDDGTSYGYLLKNSSSDTSNNALAGALYTYTDSGKAFQHIHSGTALFTILSGGSIGIGSTAPSYKLEVYSGAKTSAFTGLSISNFNNYDGTAASLVTSQLRFAILENPTGTYNAPARTFTILESGNEANNSSSDGFFAISTRSGGTVAEKLRLNSAGNLGIGTTNPTTKLAISDGTTIAQVNPSSGVAYFGSVNNYPIALSVNSSEKVRIISDGNVGIGTTSIPSPLTVYSNGDVWHFRLGSATGELRFGGQTSSGAVIQSYTPGGVVRDLYIQRDGGNIGVGTNAATARLHLVAPGNDGAPVLRIVASGSDTFNWASSTMYANLTADETAIHLIGKAQSQYNSAYLGFRHVADGSSSNMLSLGLYSADYLVNILGNGSVGIGTISPNSKLDIRNGNLELSDSAFSNIPEIRFTGNSSGRYVFAGIKADEDGQFNGHLEFWTTPVSANSTAANAAFTERMRITSAGNVGIGTTSPAYKLHVVGDGYVTGNLTVGLTSNWSNINFIRSGGSTVGGFGWRSDGYFYVAGHPDYGPGAGNDVRVRGFGANLILGTNSTDYIWLNTSGNLGIGTNNPATKLQVIGGVEFGYGSNSIFYTGTAFDASNYLILQNNTDAYGRVGLTINAKTFSAANTPSTNDGWALDPRSGIRFRGWLSGDSGYDTKFVIQHLLANATNAVGDLGIFAKGYSSTVPAFVLAGGGNVGIGTTSPAYKLDVVSGSIRASSGAYAGELYFGTNSNADLYLKRDNGYDLSLVQNASSGNALYLAGAGNVYLSIDSNNNETDRAFIVQNNSIKSGTELFRVNEAGSAIASSDFRAPIFYDSNNTGYYVDPASTSNLNAITLNNSGINSYLTLPGTVTISNVSSNEMVIRNLGQLRFSTSTSWDWNSWAGLKYDASATTIYMGGPAATSVFTANATPPSVTISFVGTTAVNSDSSFRAPIFYDSANTTYYVDPASTSNLVGLTVANTITGNITGNAGGNAAGSSTFVASLGSGLNYDIDRTTKRAGLSHYSGYSTGTNRPTTYDYTLQVTDGNKGWEISMDWIATTGPAIYARSLRDCCQNWSTWVRILDSANYTYAANMNQYVRTTDNVTHNIVDATQFRDSANTSYYLDPASTSVLNYLSLSILNNMNPANSTWHTSAEGKSRFYFATNSTTYFRTGNDFVFRNNSDTGVVVIDASGNLRTTTSGDNSPSYSLHVGGTGYAVNDFRAPIFYDSNNTGYYLDPASTTTSLQIAGAIEQGNDLARPLVQWGVGGNTTGMIVIKLPGTSSNYGMIHAIIDIYEYSGANVSTIIVGGHNWNGQWYEYGSNVIGYTNKTVRLGFKDGQYCIVLGGASSVWSYGQVVLRKIQNGAYYTNIMDLGGTYTISQTATESFTWVTGDLTQLRTPGTLIAYGSVQSPIFYDSANTSYYLDPASTSVLYSIAAGVAGNSSANIPALKVTSAGTATTQAAIAIQQQASEGDTIIFCDFDQYVEWNLVHENSANQLIVHGGTSTNNLGSNTFYSPNGTVKTGYIKHVFDMTDGNTYLGGSVGIGTTVPAQKLDVRGIIISNTDVRAPIFYDSNNTSYYFDGDAATSLNIAGQITTAKTNGTLLSIAGADTIGYNSTAGRGAYIKGTSTTYVYGSGVYYDGSNIRQMLYEDTWLNNKYFGSDGIIYSAVSMRAPIFYDYNDTNYYLDPNGGSVLKNVNVNALYPNSSTTDSDIYARDALINSYFHGDVLTYDVFQFNAASLYEVKLTSTHSFSSTTVETSIFKGDRLGGMTIANNTYQVRWTWNNTIGYKFFKSLYICNSTNGNSFTVLIEYSGNGSTWTTLATSAQMSNWPGHSWFTYLWNNNAAQGYLRLTITPTWNNANAINIYNMRYFASYNLDGAVRLYDWDYSRNVTFPSTVTATTFTGALSGNATTATTAGALTGGDSNFNALLYTSLGGDLNLYNSPGLYSAEYTGTTNKPSGYANGHFIQLSDAGGTDVKTQWYVQNDGLKIGMRIMWGNTNWQAWRSLLHDGNYNNYAPTLTGTGASGTWSINVTGNAATATVNSGNTSAGWYPIVWHSGNTHYSTSNVLIWAQNGYIQANYFNSSDNDETSITRFIIKNGDNYHRSATTTTAADIIRGVASGTWSINVTGNAATATSADNIDGRPFVNTNSNSGTNADTINSNGISYYTAGVTNFSGNATDGALYSQAYSNDWQHQIAGDYRSGQIALRGKNNGTWQSWRTVLDSTNYSSYAGGLTTGNTFTNINVFNSPNNTTVNTLSGNYGLTVFQATASTDAYITFHVGGDYAGYFGLGGAENDLVWGGWSVGNNRYRILHSGNQSYAWNLNQNLRTTDSPTFSAVTATNATISGKLVQNSTTQSITGTGQTLTLNVAAAAVQVISMASGATITTISYTNRDNNPSVNTIMLVVKYAGTASITFTNVLWANGTAPTLTGTNGYADVFMLTSYQGGAGTPVWIGTVVAQALVSTNL